MDVFWGFLLERQKGRGVIRTFRLSSHLSKDKEAIPVQKNKEHEGKTNKKQTNKTANHEICQGVQEIKTIYSHAEKARKKTNTETLQTDRHREEDTHCL